MTLFAGIDVGSSGCRCLVVDERGERVAAGARAWRYIWTGAAAELELAAVLAALEGAIGDALAACDPRDIGGVGVASMRHGIVVVDSDGREVHLSTNADGRSFAEAVALERDHGDRVYRSAGRLSSATLFMPPRLAWLRANEPDVIARAQHVLQISDWVVWRLTGRAATEPTEAAETLVFDVGKGEWSDELLETLEVPRALLPDLVATGEPAGEVTAEAAARHGFAPGTPVRAAGADIPCAALALGARAGDAAVVAGTTMMCDHVRADPSIDGAGRLWTSPFQIPGLFVHEAHAGEAGAAVGWLAGLFGVDAAALAALAERAQPGAGGVTFVDPLPTPATSFLLRRGGFSFPTPVIALGRGREDFARALLEGIAFGARMALGWLEETDGEPRAIFAGGGLARSAVFRAALAGALGRPVRVATEPESTALGAAIVGATGHHGSVAAAAEAMADPCEEVAPRDEDGYPAHEAAWRRHAEAVEATAIKVTDLL